MKKIFLLAVVATLSVAGINDAQAQDKSRHKQPNKEWQHKETYGYRDLQLSEAQKAQITQIRKEAQSQRESIRKDQTLTDEQRGQKMRALQQSQKEKMQSVLTQEQRDKMQSQGRKSGKDKMHENKGRKYGQAKRYENKGRSPKVDFTDSQKQSMKKIREDSNKKREAIKNDSNLTNEQRSQKMKELHLETKKQMESVMTPEQRNQMKRNKVTDKR